LIPDEETAMATATSRQGMRWAHRESNARRSPGRRARPQSRPGSSGFADERRESFKVTFPNGDYVHVSPPCTAEFKGDAPVLQTEVWQSMKAAKRDR
jgi:hypothetical protein